MASKLNMGDDAGPVKSHEPVEIEMSTWRENPLARASRSQIDLHVEDLESPLPTNWFARHRRAVFIGAGVAVIVVISLAIGVALYLANRPDAKRSLIVPQTFSSSFTMQPRFGMPEFKGRMFKSVRPDGSFAFELVSQQRLQSGIRQVWTVTAQRAYWQSFDDAVSTTIPVSAGCLSPEILPPVGDLNDALDDAVLYGAKQVNETMLGPCGHNPTRWVLEWGTNSVQRGNKFIACAPSDGVYAVAGRKFILSLSNVNPRATGLGLSVPVNTTGAPLSCPTWSMTPTAAASARRLATVAVIDSSVSWMVPEAAPASVALSCMLVGGVGYTADTASNYWSSFPSFLGSFCASVTYVPVDLRNSYWYTTANQDAVCKAVNVGGRQAFFTHGVGTLLLSLVLYNGRCALVAGTLWLSIGGLVQSSLPINTAKDYCKSSYPQFTPALNQALGLCTDSYTRTSVSSSLTAAGLGLSDLPGVVSYAQRSVGAVLCGSDPYGLGSPADSALSSFSDYVQYPSITGRPINDGIVAANGCALGKPLGKLGDNVAFALLPYSHIDLSCRGHSALSVDPCDWMAQRLQNFITTGVM